MQIPLKPCPFCGDHPSLDWLGTKATCANPACGFREYLWPDQWNKRAGEAGLEARILDLETQVKDLKHILDYQFDYRPDC